MGAASAPNSTRQGDTLITSTGCTCFFIDDWVEGQYVYTVIPYATGDSPLLFILDTLFWHTKTKTKKDQSAGAVEYTDCIFAEGQDFPPNECP